MDRSTPINPNLLERCWFRDSCTVRREYYDTVICLLPQRRKSTQQKKSLTWRRCGSIFIFAYRVENSRSRASRRQQPNIRSKPSLERETGINVSFDWDVAWSFGLLRRFSGDNTDLASACSFLLLSFWYASYLLLGSRLPFFSFCRLPCCDFSGVKKNQRRCRHDRHRRLVS